MTAYDYIIAGSGLTGAILARELTDAGKKVLVLERRNHVGGNIYTRTQEGIEVHQYGAHIFHTNSDRVWDYLSRFCTFNRFTNSPVAMYRGRAFSMPFNMYTFNQMWGVTTPQEAQAKIEEQRKEITHTPRNLEEQAISLVGRDIYETLVKGYTEKQWGRDCTELPTFIIRRLPVRLTWDNNYFNARHQGIPEEGYTRLIEKLLEGIEVRTGVDFLENREQWLSEADHVLYTGPIDEYYDYCYGPLEYRSLRFEEEVLDQPNFQGNAAVNYTDRDVPWTRIIEHKWFASPNTEKTIITREYPASWKPGDEPFYPLNDEKNNALYARYRNKAESEDKVRFCGRLGEYRYYDMDQAAAAALVLAQQLLHPQDGQEAA